jgi:regulator of protease activity HflC (stomatin/prohibitin superfamily)
MTHRHNLRNGAANVAALSASAIVFAIAALIIAAFLTYNFCRIDVPAKHIAVLTTKTGTDLANGQEIAPSEQHKGLQLKVLGEGRYFRNPYFYKWSVYPMIEIPENKLGVRVRLYGKDLPYGHFVAPAGSANDSQVNSEQVFKGIVPEVLRPARYDFNAILKDESGSIKNPRNRNDYVEIIELHDPVTIPAGYKGVVTNLSGPIPDDPNKFLVDSGFRGVQEATLDEGTYYLNPYVKRVQAIDCRSQRFNLADGFDMGFPSKDGFWVSLDGIIEFRVKPDQAALVYVLYDEQKPGEGAETSIDEEIIRKVIMPNARSICRLRGSNSSGREFIGGDTRSAFQAEFQELLRETCSAQGIEIVQALITKINPPQAIAGPVRDREVASQKLKQYQQQKLQQDEEAKLAREVELVEQMQTLVEADREVVKLMTEAQKNQEVALAEANRDKDVAIEELAAAKDKAEAILAEKEAEAGVIGFENEADAAGWKAAVRAFSGDGEAYARYVLYQKLSPGFKSIMTNTSDSPLMDVFKNFANKESATTDETKIESASKSDSEVDSDDGIFGEN